MPGMGDARRGERAATVRAWTFAAIIGIGIGAAMEAALGDVVLGIGLGMCSAVVFAVAFQPSVDLDPGEAVGVAAPAVAEPGPAPVADEHLITAEPHVLDGDGDPARDADPDRYAAE